MEIWNLLCKKQDKVSLGNVSSGFPGGSYGKELACNVGDLSSIAGSDPWVGKIPWSRKWQPTPVFLPREFHGTRSLADYSPWGRIE